MRACAWAAIVGEPLAIHEPGLSRADRHARAAQMLEAVGLGAEALERYPHEFSGGQRQRIGIARALILRPELVVADEPVSALDVSVGAQILELLDRLRRELSLTLILISHSLPVVAQLATRVSVMQAGKFVESGTARSSPARPAAPLHASPHRRSPGNPRVGPASCRRFSDELPPMLYLPQRRVSVRAQHAVPGVNSWLD